MLEEAPHEFVRVQAHRALLVVVTVVLPTKGDFGVADVHQSMVGDGDPVRVPAQILEHMGRAGKGALAVDDPIGSPVALEPFGEGLRVAQMRQASREGHSPGLECLAHGVQEEAPEES